MIYTPYGWHSFYVGIGKDNHTLVIPRACDLLLLGVDPLVRKELVDYSVESLDNIVEASFADHAQEAKRWLSRAA